MNYMGHLCRYIFENGPSTQRMLAESMGISLGKCNALVHDALAQGFVQGGSGGHTLTTAGRQYLELYRVRNAVIHAAGIDVRFVPFSHELPKSLLAAQNERLIERIIRQLHEKGIRDITVIVGYLAEKMEYLADKYEVRLLYNPEYAAKSNLVGIYLARQALGNTYLVNADFWMCENLFHEFEPESCIVCQHHDGPTDEWCVTLDSKRRIKSMHQGGNGGLVKRGPVFIDMATAEKLRPLLVAAYGEPGVAAHRWEYLLSRHLGSLHFLAGVQPAGTVRDFTSLEELREFDARQSRQQVSQALAVIGSVFDVPPGRAKNIDWLEASAVHHVFRFTVDGVPYTYRVPGDAASRFISYRQELSACRALQNAGVTDEPVHLGPSTGVKIARYFPRAAVIRGDLDTLRAPMALLRRLHKSGARVRHHFNIRHTLRQYELLCNREGCIHFEDYYTTFELVNSAIETIEAANGGQVLCHINAGADDFVLDGTGALRLTNWAYSGMCHPFADIAMTGLYFGCGLLGMNTLLEWYLRRPPSYAEKRLCYSFAAAGGLLWSLFGEHCQYQGDDMGQYTVAMYGLCKRFLRGLAQMD